MVQDIKDLGTFKYGKTNGLSGFNISGRGMGWGRGHKINGELIIPKFRRFIIGYSLFSISILLFYNEIFSLELCIEYSLDDKWGISCEGSLILSKEFNSTYKIFCCRI